MVRRTSTGMMRIAIAGAGGFATILAQQLSQSAHALLVLSTREHPEFEEYDCQVAVVNYHDVEDLRFTLQGVDLVISTISGPEQINLIDAARRARVRRFVPSEFEGAISHRPTQTGTTAAAGGGSDGGGGGGSDPLDNGSSTARDLLQQWSQSRSFPMRSTVFSCGVFYERFAPGGLQAYNMGTGTTGVGATAAWRLQGQGSYLVDLGSGAGDIPAADARGRPVHLVLTSAFDVARYVAAAVEMGIDNWPAEFRVLGARLTTQGLVRVFEEVRGFHFQVNARPYTEIVSWLQYFEENNEQEKWYFMQHLLQTANGRYTFGNANLNDMVDFQPVGFREWLREVWGQAQ